MLHLSEEVIITNRYANLSKRKRWCLRSTWTPSRQLFRINLIHANVNVADSLQTSCSKAVVISNTSISNKIWVTVQWAVPIKVMSFTLQLIRIMAQINPCRLPSSEMSIMYGGIRMASTQRTAKIPTYKEMCSLGNQRSKSGSKMPAIVRSRFDSSKATAVVLTIARIYSINRVKTLDLIVTKLCSRTNRSNLGWTLSIRHLPQSRPLLILARPSFPTAQVLLIRLCSLINKYHISISAASKRQNSKICPNLSTTTSRSWIIAKWILVNLNKRATNTS